LENLDGGSPFFLAACGIVLSQDDKFVYVLNGQGNSESTVYVFSRNTKTFGLTFVESFLAEVPFEGGTRPFNDPTSIKMTDDGKFLIIAGRSRFGSSGSEGYVASLGIDGSSGKLSVADAVNTYLASVRYNGMALSPDGEHLYLFGSGPGHFQFDSTTGGLTLISTHPSNTTVPALGFLGEPAISPDGKHLYGQGLFATTGGLGGSSPETRRVIYERDLDSGDLTLIDEVQWNQSEISPPVDAAIAPDGSYVYFQDKADNSASLVIGTYSRDADSGLLSLVHDPVPGRTMMMTPSGDGLLVTDSDNQVLSFYDRNANTGLLSFASGVPRGTGGDVDKIMPIGFMAFTPDKQTIFAVGENIESPGGDDYLAEFSRSLPGNVLSFIAFEEAGTGGVEGLADIQAGDLSPDGRRLYIATNNDKYVDESDGWGNLTVYERYSDGPELSIFERLRSGNSSPPFSGNQFAVSDTEELALMGPSRFSHVLIPFVRNSTTGMLEVVPDINSFRGTFAFVPDSNMFYYFRGSPGPFQAIRFGDLDTLSGLVELAEPFDLTARVSEDDDGVLATRKGIQVDSSGVNLYLSGHYGIGSKTENAGTYRMIAHVQRNAETNELATRHFHLYLAPGKHSINIGLYSDLALSPDGRNLYAHANTDQTTAIVIADRDLDDGDLGNFRYWRTGIDSTSGPSNIMQIKVTPDGLHVLVLEHEPADPADEYGVQVTRIYRYNRNPTNGDIELDELFETLAFGAPPDFIDPTRMLFEISDPDDADPVVYIGAYERLIGLDLN
jgi:DNA-binding beta-propeller fold protein YncE